MLASMGRGCTAPNPMVGAVLVHNGCIIGEGYHRKYGEAHAEVDCLNSVRENDRHLIPDSTIYISLEPCAHFGKTPPCASRIIAENIKEVVVCNNDPFAEVNGKGFEMLHQKGIKTTSGILEKEGLWLNRRFFRFHTHRRPYVILKWAQTQQGFFAPLNRTRYQMSNRHSMQLVHRWRTEEAAILVGTNTCLSDDPILTARLWKGKQPLRIVIDRKLVLPSGLRIFNEEADTWVVNEVKESKERNIRYVKLDFLDDVISQLLFRLHEAGIMSLIVEGGASLLENFIQKGLWDEARVFHTPDVLNEGIPAPMLMNAFPAFNCALETDSLHVYTHQDNPYRYIPEMEL